MNQALLTIQSSTDSTLLDLDGDEFISLLDARIDAVYSDLITTDLWKTLQSVDTPIELLRHFMREVSLEISSYQPRAAKAAITAIGRMPRSLDERAVKTMLRHQAEVFTHGEMALRDYHTLGGDVEWARQQSPSSAAYAVASVWSAIANERDSFAYLGALYASEGLIQQVASGTVGALLGRGFSADALEFVSSHSEEDAKYTALIRALIGKVAKRFQDSRDSILHGTDNLLNIFPLPVWQTAFDRALESFEREAAA